MRVARVPLFVSLLFSISLHSQTTIQLFSDLNAKYPALSSARHLSLNGDADRFIGGQHETGTAVFHVASNGASSMELNFSSDSRTERHTAYSERRACHWSGKDGEEHETKGPDCQRFIPWFAPMLMVTSVPVGSLPWSLEDKGTVTKGSRTLHKIVLTASLKNSNAQREAILKELTRVDLFFDPESLFLDSADFDLHSDVNWNRSVKVHVVYSNYQMVSGIPMPYTIDRYVNGVPEIKIHIQTASAQ